MKTWLLHLLVAWDGLFTASSRHHCIAASKLQSMKFTHTKKKETKILYFISRKLKSVSQAINWWKCENILNRGAVMRMRMRRRMCTLPMYSVCRVQSSSRLTAEWVCRACTHYKHASCKSASHPFKSVFYLLLLLHFYFWLTFAVKEEKKLLKVIFEPIQDCITYTDTPYRLIHVVSLSPYPFSLSLIFHKSHKNHKWRAGMTRSVWVTL